MLFQQQIVHFGKIRAVGLAICRRYASDKEERSKRGKTAETIARAGKSYGMGLHVDKFQPSERPVQQRDQAFQRGRHRAAVRHGVFGGSHL